MPATVAVPLGMAALGAASKYGAATSQGRAMREAAAAQERSATQALEYQKTRDSRLDSVEDRKWNLYQQYVQDYIRRHGGNPGAMGGAPASGGGGVSASPVSIADLMAGQQSVGDATANPQAAMQGQSMADAVGQWNDWKRYGA